VESSDIRLSGASTVETSIGGMTMTDEDTQEVVKTVDKHLQKALKHAERYMSHDDIRPSASMAFEQINEARLELDKIDEREFSDE